MGKVQLDPLDIDPNDSGYYWSLVMHAGVVQYAIDKRGMRITVPLVKKAAESGRLPYAIVSGRRCFAPKLVDAWLLSLAKTPAVSA